jgi:hypothetical protein
MPRWSSAENEKLRELAGLRWSGQQIAEALGKSQRSVARYAHDNDIQICSRYVERYTHEDGRRIRILAEGGLAARDIAKALGGNRTKCGVTNWCSRHNIHLFANKIPRVWTPEMVERLRSCVRVGKSKRYIATELGMTKFAISGKISELGLKMWTNDRHELLKAQAERGASAAEIAAMIGLTRNAVIGRAARTGVKLLAGQAQRDRGPKERAMSKESKRKWRARNISMGLNSRGKPRSPHPGPKPGKVAAIRRPQKLAPLPWVPPDDPGIRHDSPRGAGEAMLELARRGCVCHWPHGDPSDDGFTFCFAPQRPFAQLPYCEFHLEKSRANSRLAA